MTLNTNPVIATVALAHPAFKGWHVRQYRNGKYDAVNGLAVTPGYDSFKEVTEYLAAQAVARGAEARS